MSMDINNTEIADAIRMLVSSMYRDMTGNDYEQYMYDTEIKQLANRIKMEINSHILRLMQAIKP